MSKQSQPSTAAENATDNDHLLRAAKSALIEAEFDFARLDKATRSAVGVVELLRHLAKGQAQMHGDGLKVDWWSLGELLDVCASDLQQARGVISTLAEYHETEEAADAA